MKHFLFLLPLLIFGVMSGYFLTGLGKDTATIPSVFIDKPIPQIEATPLKANKPGIVTADFQGEVKVLNVWASWCIPCRAEHPLITRLAEQEEVPVYGLNWKDRSEAAVAWLDELGDPYHGIGFDQSGRAGIELGVYGVPETYVVDKTGRIRYKRTGPVTPAIMEEEIIPLIRDLRQ